MSDFWKPPTGTRETSPCSGQCCVQFPLSIARSGKETIEALLSPAPPEYAEGEFIADMLIPFEGPLRPPGSTTVWRQGEAPDGKDPYAHEFPSFTCRHLTATGCGVFDQRPDLCRRHGVDWLTPCDHHRDESCTIRVERPALVPVENLTARLDYEKACIV